MFLPCMADGLNSFADLSRQFGSTAGNPVSAGMDTAYGYNLTETNFRYNGMDISVITEDVGASTLVTKITISRDSAFNSLEIPDILKLLSSSGDWTQKDDSNWTLSDSKVKANWNGENKIFVTTDPSTIPPRVLPPRGTGSYGN